MGLDNYALPSQDGDLSREDIQAFVQSGVRLGGLEGSFRGKLYYEFIEEITGVNLYQDWIPPVTIKKMYQALVKYDPKKAVAKDYCSDPITESQILELQTFFKICSERNLGLRSSY